MRGRGRSPATSSRSLLAFVAALALAQLVLAADCVDGKTPDCSDAAAGCGPDLAPDAQEGSVLPEAAPNDATPDQAATDGNADAGNDADADNLDAGDEI